MVPVSARLAMVRAVSVGYSMIGGVEPGKRLPQHDMVGWTKTLALRRLSSSNTGAKAGSPSNLPS